MFRVRFFMIAACAAALVAAAACVPPPGPAPSTTTTSTTVPSGPEKVSGVLSMELTSYRNCMILDADRPAACTGSSAWFSFVLGPRSMAGTSGATDVASGWQTDCAVVDGGVWCQGENSHGQLGTAIPLGEWTATPVQIPGIDTAVEIEGGGMSYCARLSSGAVRCWGMGMGGALGNGSSTDSATPVAVVGVGDATQLSGHNNGMCALRGTGQVSCWGIHNRGDGFGAWSSPFTPTFVSGITNATQVVNAKGNTGATCAVLADDTVRCWGTVNDFGQVGDGTTAEQLTPVVPSGLGEVADLALSSVGGCAVRVGGDVACWGANAEGRVGDGTDVDRVSPTDVVGLPGPAASVATSGDHSCAALISGELWCWGANLHGQLGDGSVTVSLVPVHADGLDDAAEVAVSNTFSCAIGADTSMWCWGYRGSGSLGIAGDGYTNVAVPTRVDAPFE